MDSVFKNVHMVVGCNYGDEGKGQTTREIHEMLLKNNETIINVRYGGSAQAGHTVDTGSTRIVYKHFGAGSFLADTYLDLNFTLNPFEFQREHQKLLSLGYNNSVMCNPGCSIITPEMMLLNQVLETARGSSAHGSCGMGVFECELAKRAGVNFTYNSAAHQLDPGSYFYSRVAIDWYYTRLHQILTEFPNWYQDPRIKKIVLDAKDIIQNSTFRPLALGSIEYLLDNTETQELQDLPKKYTSCVFESSQGMLLTEKYGEMPHCTPSLINPSQYAERMGCLNEAQNTKLHFITRSYLTRHGNGPLAYEQTEEELGLDVFDPTNAPNQFQGTIRYAPLDLSRMKECVSNEIEEFKRILKWDNISTELVVTCLGHSSSKIKTQMGDMDISEFLEVLCQDFQDIGSFVFAWKNRKYRVSQF